MKKKIISGILFILSVMALVISMKLFWNMGLYADEYGTSPSVVYQGEFWLYMDWIRLALLSIITILSGIKLFQK
ncbi:MAG: hypothetical protein E7256_09200 [Lachnospiraceae bacterium]|nr:hypothetical protein [Lachnospiraceae bacterium]